MALTGQTPANENESAPKKSGGRVRRWLSGLFLAAATTGCAADPDPADLSYTTLIEYAHEGKVKAVRLEGNKITATEQTFRVTAGPVTYKEPDDSLREALKGTGVRISVVPEKEPPSPWLLIGGFLLASTALSVAFQYFSMKNAGGKMNLFGKANARSGSTKVVKFKDVAGADESKAEVEEIVEFLEDPKKFTRLGGRIPKGILMHGPPGTGKTLLARAIAGEAGVPFFSISGSDFVEMYVGVGAARVRDLFRQARKKAPCVLFIDEIDAIGGARQAHGGNDERAQTLNQLLVEMDGFDPSSNVIVIAATNRLDTLDPAILRPGRFDRKIEIGRPDRAGRAAILAVHTEKVPLDDDVDLDIIAAGTTGFVGADLEHLVNEAALHAARHDKDRVDAEDFEMAKDRVMMGAERRATIMSDKERKITAHHEAGHTIMAKKTPGATPPHKVTIIPRDGALGMLVSLQKQDEHLMTQEQGNARIAVAYGGRVGEELLSGGDESQYTTGAEEDFRAATRIARPMVMRWGFSKLLKGYRSYDPVEQGGGGVLSQDKARLIDGAVDALLEERLEYTRNTMKEHEQAWRTMAKYLLQHETLDAKQIDDICEGRTPVFAAKKEKSSPRASAPPPPPSVTAQEPAALGFNRGLVEPGFK